MGSSIQKITADEVLSQLQSGHSLSIIDVREDDEIKEGKIPGVIHIPMAEVPERLDEIDRDTEYIIVCRSGNRSGRITEFLSSQGYQAKNMTGGMLAWKGDLEISNM